MRDDENAIKLCCIICDALYREQEVKSGGQRRRISEARARIAYYLSREMGICMAEIARNLGVGTSAVAMAIKKEESSSRN